MVVRLEKTMSDTISENDLRRAIGLALEEFDSQLTEAFRDSSRKALAMFAKCEDVVEIQNMINKKVNFDQYNSVLHKLSDLRKYIDTMAESVFIGHQESQQEYAKEEFVEKSLKLKADLNELTEVRSKLERLEAIVSSNDTKHNSTMDELELTMASSLSNFDLTSVSSFKSALSFKDFSTNSSFAYSCCDSWWPIKTDSAIVSMYLRRSESLCRTELY
jgi:hypothetical protein